MTKYSETSTRCARAILKAWRSRNFDLLDQKLAKAAVVESTSEDTGECERWELLNGIAHEFRRVLASGRIQEAVVYLPLLENLARPAVVSSRRAAAAPYWHVATAVPASIQ